MKQPAILLVDGAAGIYNYKVLVEKFQLVIQVGEEHIPLDEWMAGREDFKSETLETVFCPDNHLYLENIEYITENQTLRVKDDKQLLNLDCFDGDLFGIHLDAEWDDKKGWHFPE